MSNGTSSSWQKQFGLDVRNAPEFFESSEDLSGNTPQAHLLQRGFDDLGLDGVLCAGNSPLVYFLLVDDIDDETTTYLYRSFWLHGGAPVFVLVSDKSVNVYSGLTLSSVDDESAGLVTTLSRIEDDLASFLLSIESGEFFHANRQYFNPEHRVDRALLANLNDTRGQLNDLSQRNIPEEVLDGLLCRLVFTAYLFDRGVIDTKYLQSLGINDCEHLRDVLGIQPTGKAKESLYRLFGQLAEDFNGDLFAANLNSESKLIVNKHIEVLSAFFHGTSVATGQKSFWPYDFGAIPVETISAIYEHFLKDKDKDDGAFYTPRFLAEVVLDVAFEKEKHLLGNTFLDPSCGSGIFLVGIFNRLAHEWRRDNPRARNNTLARELMKIIQESLFGIDINPTACRIAAFSLYLAYLDHLSPREIQQLQEKGRALPNLVSDEDNSRNLTCADFFSDSDNIPQEVSYVIGNPPWGSTAGPQTAAGLWCTQNGVELSDRQIASAFIRKGALHVREIGRVCFVLPAGVLFSRRPKATNLQIEWISRHTLECVLNLSDYRFFLFERATYPAIIARYRRQAPTNKQMVSLKIDYWSPKSDWSVTKAEIIRIAPNDRVQFSIGNLLRNLSGPDSSQIWKRHFWATARDRRLMERLSDHPRLKDNVRQTREQSDKRWLIAQGFQPLGPGDDPEEAKQIELPNSLFLEATTRDFNLFVEPSDCVDLGESVISVRKRSSVVTEVFKAPHVLISGGFSKIAFLDFDASFRSSVRGIHGPQEDANLLVFLAAYLKSKLARYFLFHISSSWAVDRPRVYDDEILLLPFPFPKDNANVDKANSIVATVNSIMKEAMSMHQLERSTKASIIDEAMNQIDECILDYFSITASERELINETINISIPSVHPTQSRLNVPTVRQSSANQRETYVSRVCDLLNGWSKRSGFGVRGQVISSEKSGIGLAVFEKVDRTLVAEPMPPETEGAIEIVYRLRQVVSKKNGALELTRGIKIFDRNKLYIVNTLDQRNWTLTSAMNDADEIAGTLLMKKAGQSV